MKTNERQEKKPKCPRIKNQDMKFYVMMIIFVLAFWIVIHFIGVSPLKDVISTTTGLIAAVMVWLQLKRTERLNEASYIKDLNNQFINNKDMTKVEHALELYYNQLREGCENPVLQLNLSRDSEDCQKLINYLVYLESIASIIQQRILHIEAIHNLFAYRFFIAVNNPIVQMFELYPYSEYYQGIFFLSEYWTAKCNEKNKRLSMRIPMRQFALNPKKAPGENVNLRPAKKSDAYSIAGVLYQTDPYIYPTAFGEDKKNAAFALSKLVEREAGLFSYKNIYVITNDSKIVGTALCVKGACNWDTEECLSAMKSAIEDKEKFEYVANEYFSKQGNENRVTLVAMAIDSEYTGHHYGYHLLSYISNIYIKDRMELDVLRDNSIAVELYRKFGFTVQNSIQGFAPQDESKPKVIHMIRPSLISVND